MSAGLFPDLDDLALEHPNNNVDVNFIAKCIKQLFINDNAEFITQHHDRLKKMTFSKYPGDPAYAAMDILLTLHHDILTENNKALKSRLRYYEMGNHGELKDYFRDKVNEIYGKFSQCKRLSGSPTLSTETRSLIPA